MRVAVRYMAQLRAAAGVADESVELAVPGSAFDLLPLLAERHGEALRRLLLGSDGRPHPAILIFIDDTQVTREDASLLKDGDVITLLSPVAGGAGR